MIYCPTLWLTNEQQRKPFQYKEDIQLTIKLHDWVALGISYYPSQLFWSLGWYRIFARGQRLPDLKSTRKCVIHFHNNNLKTNCSLTPCRHCSSCFCPIYITFAYSQNYLCKGRTNFPCPHPKKFKNVSTVNEVCMPALYYNLEMKHFTHF